MADCSAQGTTLERILSAATGNNNASATKTINKLLLGNSNSSSTMTSAMQQQPVAVPTHLPQLPTTTAATASINNVSISTNNNNSSMIIGSSSSSRNEKLSSSWMNHNVNVNTTTTSATTMDNNIMNRNAATAAAVSFQQQQQMFSLYQNSQMIQSHIDQMKRRSSYYSGNSVVVSNNNNSDARAEPSLLLSSEADAVTIDRLQPLHAESSADNTITTAATSNVLDEAWQHQDMQPVEEWWHDGLEEEWNREEGVNGASMEELAKAWSDAERQFDQHHHQHLIDTPYEYHDESQNISNKNPMSEGLVCFEKGEIMQAIYNFEAELRNHNPDNADAWRMLGKCYAENDQDRMAISCLERAVEKDPYSLEALLSLGVSYVNEYNIPSALHYLKSWVQNNPNYTSLKITDDGYGDNSLLDDVQNLLLQALQFNNSNRQETNNFTTNNNADVLEALGVCYNASREYDAAVDTFKKALQLKPNDYQLWNKLGATFANSQRSDEALPAYNKALEIKPKYARCWLNMAISHSNLKNYDEAARCYLQALSLNPNATHCWSYLRIALTCSERWDLLPFASSQNLNAFRAEYDFI